jgi:hypothetical protein
MNEVRSRASTVKVRFLEVGSCDFVVELCWAVDLVLSNSSHGVQNLNSIVLLSVAIAHFVSSFVLQFEF